MNYWISTPAFTCGILVDEKEIIRDSAPILKRFRNQKFGKLKSWIYSKWSSQVQIEKIG